MNKERLLDCANVLDTVNPVKFNMGCWWSRCGAVGCAIGWYCTLTKDIDLKLGAFDYPRFGPYGGFAAITRYFDIGYLEARVLFDEEHYNLDVEPLDVANKIRKFVNGEIINI